MRLTKRPVDLDISIVPVRREPDQLISSDQTSEAALVRTARRHVLRLINDDPGQITVLVEQSPEAFDHLYIRVPTVPLPDHSLCCEEYLRINDRFECVIGAYPHFRAVFEPLFLKLERTTVIDVVADVFLVRQNLVNGSPRPGTAKVRRYAVVIKLRCDLALDIASVDELAVQGLSRSLLKM